jgi:ribonucleoside-triphosphate reductase
MNDLGVSNSLGSGSVKIGSIGVVTLNLPYIWYKAGRPKGIYAYIASMKEQARNACYINHAKRQYVKKRIDEGALPLYTHGYMDLSRQYSTIGFTGMAEVVTKLGYEDLEERTEAMAQLLTALNEVCDECNEKFNAPHNVEQTPSESSAVKLSKKTKVMFEDAKDDVAFYSNQFIPLTQDVDIADRIYAQGKLDQLCSGGSILHLNIGEPIADAQVMADLIDDVIASGCMYFAVNYRLHKCVNNHMSAGGTEKDKCPVCGEAITDSYTRVVGFLTNVKNWNKTRQKLDYPNRVFK